MNQVRRPAEFEPIDRVWVSAPHNRETWPGERILELAQAQFEAFTQALSRVVDVVDVATLGIDTEDSWIRDYGPCFVEVDGKLAIRDFGFNAWGEKYGDGAIDTQVPAKIAKYMGVACESVAMVLEGGAMESDGQGTGMTTASCLFHESRNPQMDRERIKQIVCDTLGFDRLHVLPGGDIEGDDTDGHVDNLVRFLGPDVLAISLAEAHHPAYALTQSNWDAAGLLQSAAGGRYERVALPVPEGISFAYPGDQWTAARELALPASYANFLLANGTVFVPTFGQAADDVACRRLESAVGRGWRVEPVRSEWLVIGQGALHCLTQQQPRI